MRARILALMLAFVADFGLALAQDAAVGTFRGSFDAHTNIGLVSVGVTLTISSVDDGKVTGTGNLARGVCAGNYPLAGTLKGADLAVRATQKGGPAGDCSFGFRGKVDGNRLVGTMGKYEVELRK